MTNFPTHYESSGTMQKGTVVFQLSEITGGTSKKIIAVRNSFDILVPNYVVISATTMTTGFTKSTTINNLYFTYGNSVYNTGSTLAIGLPNGNLGYGIVYSGILNPNSTSSTTNLKNGITAYSNSTTMASNLGQDLWVTPQAGIVGGIGGPISVTVYADLLQ